MLKSPDRQPQHDRPRLTAALWTPDTYATVRKTVLALKAQTVQHQIELLLLGPSRAALEPVASDLEGFASHQLIELDSMAKSSQIRAEEIRRASAPIVAFLQDHAFPVRGWAEALLACYESGPWSGVGFVLANDNPRTVVSWCHFLLHYGNWVEPLPPGEPKFIGDHLASYRRDALLDYGSALDDKMESPIAMHLEMQERGHRFAVAPGAVVFHQNYSRFTPSMTLRFQSGRLFAAKRTASWSRSRRLLYALASPLIPVVRLVRLVRTTLRIGRAGLLPRLVPLSLPLLICDGAGQAVGSLAGAGGAMEWITSVEAHRHRFMRESDPSAFSELCSDAPEGAG
jgi:hypothetical protein